MKLSILIFRTSLVFGVLSLLLSSCNYYTYYVPTGSTIQEVTEPDSIKIYSGDIDQAYVVIANIAADRLGNGEDAANYVKKKAAEIGADAIIHARLTKLNTYAQRTGMSGIAVRLVQ